MCGILAEARDKFAAIVEQHALALSRVEVKARPLSPQQAVGQPGYNDLALLRGKEVMIQAEALGARGQAFTDEPGDWSGTVGQALALPLTSSRNRAFLVATMNAVLRHLGLVEQTVHCRDEQVARCGQRMAQQVRSQHGLVNVGVIGYQPGLLSGLTQQFGARRVRLTDLNSANIGRQVSGVAVWDGGTATDALIDWADLVLATGSTVVNGSLDGILSRARADGKPVILYGVTAAALCHLVGLPRLCPEGA